MMTVTAERFRELLLRHIEDRHFEIPDPLMTLYEEMTLHHSLHLLRPADHTEEEL
jgi:hypothetical protein